MFIDYLPWQATGQGTGNTVVNKYVLFTSCCEFRRQTKTNQEKLIEKITNCGMWY